MLASCSADNQLAVWDLALERDPKRKRCSALSLRLARLAPPGAVRLGLRTPGPRLGFCLRSSPAHARVFVRGACDGASTSEENAPTSMSNVEARAALQQWREAHQTKLFWKRMEQLQEKRTTVHVTVASVNRGGLVVDYSPHDGVRIRGFVPRSQLGPAMDLSTLGALVGSELPVKFIEVSEAKNRMVFSPTGTREAQEAKAAAMLKTFSIGNAVKGTVQSVHTYGALVALQDGFVGLLHVSQISQERVININEILRKGDSVKAMVLSIDAERIAAAVAMQTTASLAGTSASGARGYLSLGLPSGRLPLVPAPVPAPVPTLMIQPPPQQQQQLAYQMQVQQMQVRLQQKQRQEQLQQQQSQREEQLRLRQSQREAQQLLEQAMLRLQQEHEEEQLQQQQEQQEEQHQLRQKHELEQHLLLDGGCQRFWCFRGSRSRSRSSGRASDVSGRPEGAAEAQGAAGAAAPPHSRCGGSGTGGSGAGGSAAAGAAEAPPRRRVFCVVCMDEERCVTLVPCGHRVLCSGCTSSVHAVSDECPMCRAPIEDAVSG
ncbi:hypothetical protein FOA52_000529 [Chlamydomonas sp. UWO 241]|nr:hypothetical protein FOA52_000529 [Chlamydomonas sp. UWO 241]